jgi:monofunctional biosynthetic peptidoglycan transglycosylase
MSALRSILRWSGAFVLWSVVVSVLWVCLLGMVDPPVTWLMAAQAREHGALHRTTVPLERMARQMPLAVIASEDQRFFHHRGFEWERIRSAMEQNARTKGRRVRGASTITQQTVKNVFLWPGRTYVRKAVETWFTVLVETFWSKERIVEVYLNVAEMGEGVFGAEAAAQHCFGRSAAELTPAQCALIAASLPAPRRSSCAAPSSYLRGRQQWVVRQMRNIGDQMDPEVRRRVGEKIKRERKGKEARSGE